MFYAHDILQKKGGKFGIVWIAATRSIKVLNKRDVVSVNIPKACDDIIDYIMVRHGKLHDRRRFSLYLSAQLMYGIVKLHQKQGLYYLSDTMEYIRNLNLLSAQTSLRYIDMSPSKDLQVLRTFDTDWGNPCFGQLGGVSDSLFQYSDEDFFVIRRTPISPPLSPLLGSLEMQRPDDMLTGSPHTVSSRGDILIQEDPVSDVRREELAAVMDDLPPLDHEALERLSHAESELKMTDALLFHDDVSSALNKRVEEDAGTRQPTTDPEQEDTVLEIDPKTGDLINSLIETPIIPSAVEPRHLPVQRRNRSDTKSPRSQRKRGRPERFDSLEIDSLDLADVPQKRRAARRLRFVDGSTQLSREQLRRNMNNTSDTMRPLDTIYPSRQESAADLFSKPGLRGLQREPHLSLWRRNAVTEQMSERDESDSENDKNIPYTIRDMLRQLQQNDESSSVVEERREDSTLESTSAQDQPLTSTAIKASSGKRKRSIDSDDPEQRRDGSNTNESSSNLPVTSFQHLSGIQSMHEDSRISDRQTSAASRNIESITESLNRRADVAILEEPELEQQLQPEHMENPPIYVEEPREVPAEMEIPAQARITPAHVYRKLEELLQGDASLEIPFRILVPVDMPKWVAAKYFYCCLVLLKQRKISCQQERPYDDIFIWLRRRTQ